MANEKSPQRAKLSTDDSKLVSTFFSIVRKAPKKRNAKNKLVIANASLGDDIKKIIAKISKLQPSTKAKGTETEKENVRRELARFNDTYKPFLNLKK